jgi:5-methylcytosine-specific restriction endonuclease McrA
MFDFLRRLVARREATPQDGLYGRSWKWPRVRATHLEREPRCIACGRDKDLEVHHVVPYHLDPSRELDDGNLITLCADPCHLVHGHLMSWLRWNPSVREDCRTYAAKLAAAKALAER